ncbi:MAG: valine--tRNA ligase [Bacteroidetes bacterium CG2_30_32_10]|nr:MAG: valine--tRNA ligase [Bacteroidetes bacterium CG2_30_32_10]
MEISKQYSPIQIEDKWYAFWLANGFFKSTPDEREPYTIVIPPPNVTGVLHMGHMLNNTIQDVLIRRARMLGKNACWLPGTDHASIATEAKVVNKLKQEGIKKTDISREEFVKHAWEWTHKHGGIILEQLKKLGASCDWDRTKFTMDADLSESVIDVFIDLFNKGLIYRGVRMVNWDPKALTALSDEEVIYKEVNSKLYYIKYQIEGTTDQWISIATTRPETILGDTAVCVHPDDERYAHLKGKMAIVPLINRAVPVIFDAYVEKEFGTGALKVTPAHDINDYNLGIKHHLKSIDIFNDNGTLNEKAQLYINEDRFEVRKKISKELTEKGFLYKTEDIINKVGFSERTDAVIEPKLSMQWFCKMTEMAKPALEVVMNDTIKFHPAKFKNTYRHWLEDVKDWCISRQLWWGHQIPAYYLPNGDFVIAKTLEEAYQKALKTDATLKVGDLKQEEDVLDTWFSSWLWPISVFDGIRNPDNKDIKYYYPTNDLITAPDILFFWVARMIMAGLEYHKQVPFTNVYLTGMVRDKQGRKMSKQLGNSPDPIELMKIFGADGVRFGMLCSSPAGNDLLFDESYCEQGRNFNNKIWNVFRLVKGWEISNAITQPQYAQVSIEWFDAIFNKTLETINDHFNKFRISEALMAVYKLIWDDFCSWFLEMIKPAYLQPIDKATYDQTIAFLEKLLKVLHPFMPFITEEIWHLIEERKQNESIMITRLPQVEKYNEKVIASFDYVKEVIMALRNFRKEKNIPNKEQIAVIIKKNNNEQANVTYDNLVVKLCNLKSLSYSESKVEGAFTFIVNTTEFYIPLEENIDKEAEIIKLKQELAYNKGFLESVIKKLSNERFVNNAPPNVLQMERKKQMDAEAKISVIEAQLSNLLK